MKIKVLSKVLAVAVLFFSSGIALAQMGTPSGFPSTQRPQTQRTPFGDKSADDPTALSPAAQQQIEKGRQSDRQRRLIADTTRLLALANELKQEMDKTTKDTLSIEVIKKAEEIEKLARSVKERMKG